MSHKQVFESPKFELKPNPNLKHFNQGSVKAVFKNTLIDVLFKDKHVQQGLQCVTIYESNRRKLKPNFKNTRMGLNYMPYVGEGLHPLTSSTKERRSKGD